ncbi:hypothetical protein [Arthrobacter sp. HS15c]|uniref:hypothetical protein n=1 Tax=Arthrobacter sp. HS15c TaxID=3230279 RepID=UPI0034663E37
MLAATAPVDGMRFVIWDNKSWGLSSVDDVNYHSSPNGNIGFGSAVNRVHELYDYDRILLLNSDIEMDPELFNRIVLRNYELSETTIWSPTLLNADGSLQTAPESLYMRTPVQEVFDIFGFPAKRQRRAQPLYYVRGAVFSISRRLLQQSGGFDEAFFLYGEEADLCFRLDGCCELVVDPVVCVIHHGSQGNKGKSREALRHSYNARVLLHKKYSGSLAARVVQIAVNCATTARDAKSLGTQWAQKLSAAVSR